MAGYGEEQFSVVAELKHDELISLWLHYRNKNAYAISQDGTVMREGDSLYVRSPAFKDRDWANRWVAIATRNEATICLDNRPRDGRWEGPIRQQIKVAVEDFCGQNAMTDQCRYYPEDLDNAATLIYTLPREFRPEVTKEDEERITGISLINNSLRVTTANGVTSSYRLERLFHQQYPLGMNDGRKEDKIEVSLHVSGREQQYDSANDRLPKPVTQYWHPHEGWVAEPFRNRPRFGIHPSGEPYIPPQPRDEDIDDE